MTNTLIFSNSSNDWISVIEKFSKKEWRPIYWLVFNESQKNIILETFTDSKLNVYLIEELNYVIKNSENKFLVDEKILKSISSDFLVINKLIDRLNSKLNNDEREILIVNHVNFWINKIIGDEIEILFMSETPHNIFTYLIYLAFKILEKKIYFFGHTALQNVIYLKNGIDNQLKLNLDKKEINKISNMFLKYYSRIESAKNYDEMMPAGDFRQLSNKKTNFKFFRTVFKSKKTIKNFGFKYAFNKLYNTFYSKIFRKILKRQYKKHSNYNIELRDNYVYFSLHYQPERTTLPEGGLYYDQLNVIMLLRSIIPRKIKIFVKEHPAQFNSYESFRGRTLNFYDKLTRLHNVELVPMNVKPFNLIDKAKFVVTLTGTIGFESLARKKPVLCLARPWYESLPNVFYVKNYNQIKVVVRTLLKNYEFIEITEQNFYEFSKNFIRGKLNKEHSSDENNNNIDDIITKTEFIENIYNAIHTNLN